MKVTYTILFAAVSQKLSPMFADESVAPLQSESSSVSAGINFDRIVRKLFRSMRFDYDLEIDDVLLNVLNRLFGLKKNLYMLRSGLFSSKNTDG